MVYASPYFQIVSGDIEYKPRYTVMDALSLGTGMDASGGGGLAAADSDLMMTPAGAGGSLGVLSMRSTAEGPTQINIVLGLWENAVAKTGTKVSLSYIEIGGEIEVEGENGLTYATVPTIANGGLLVTSGTGAISASTAHGDLLAYQNGRLRIAQSGDRIQLQVLQQLTPVDAGSFRLRCMRVAGATKP
jgi:hypothetical protein